MISVFKCGYDSKHPTNFEMHRPHGSPDYTLLLVKTEAYFYVDGVPVDTKPNTVLLYDKTAAVRYGCRRKNYNDDWIHFDMTEDELPFFENLAIPCNGILSQLRMSILNAPHKKWTVPDMAQTVHMSPSYFQHLYKQMFGISCMQDVIAARLKNAKFYLRTSDMSIQSLAEFCGYENELHFMRQFKKQEGMTPTQYREHFRSW